MIHHRIRDEVLRVGERFRQLWLRRALAIVCLAALAAGLGLLAARVATGWRSELSAPFVAAVAAIAALAVAILGRRVARESLWVARRIEARYPELDASLLAALEQRPELPDGRFGFLQDALFSEVMAHSRRVSWLQVVPDRRLSRALAGNVLALAGLAVVLVALGRTPETSGPGLEQAKAPEPIGGGPSPSYEVKVDPGDIEIERGSSLLIVARFARDVPPEAALVLRTRSGDERRLRMSRSLDDPLFGVRLESVAEDLEYLVEFAEARSPAFQVTVFEFPEVARSDANLVFPSFTGLEPKTIEDTRRVSFVAGTELTWLLRLNKDVSLAELLDEAGTATRLEAGEEEMTVRSPPILLQASIRYRVRLVDDRGRENRDPHELTVQVHPNGPADVRLVRPKGDVKVSPLEELGLEAKVRDDFGLLEYGLTYALAGQPPRNVVLSSGAPGREAREARHLLDFEALRAKPDQLVSYYFWADDVGPGGEPRRTFSDMYFAEVRPFDEIFRQGQEPPEGEPEESQREREEQAGEAGGNAQDAEELAEIQKEIVSGTWNLMRGAPRRGAAAKDGAGADLARDAGLLRDAQESALEQARALAERLGNEASRADIEAVLKAMNTALERLGEAAAGPSSGPLEPALAAEQSAYEGLLRLRTREFDVVRGGNQSRSSRGSRGSQARSRRQLSELELSSSRNRYETQRSAPRERDERPEQAEDRQVSSRLRDLARRQADVNERLKDVDSALAEAREKNDREEIERQLKRLRDEERRILSDTDELTERMDRPENQERMGEARDQLQETRDDVRRASEALEGGRVSQAVAEGTRAARELEDLREEFRRRTARQFVEEMEELRAGAERLARNEEDLSSRLGDLDREEKRSLRGGDERGQVEEGLARQRKDLDDMLQRMQETVEKAEKPEPLLAEKLYDVVRGARHSRVPEALDAARTALESGLVSEAGRAERQARDGVEKFRAGVEEAAETVLGDETEALRRAGQELERLTEDVEREAARAGDPGGAEPRAREPGAAEAARGEPQDGAQEGSGEGDPERGRSADAGERVASGQGGEGGAREAEGSPSGRGAAGEDGIPPGVEDGQRGGARGLRGGREGRGGPRGGEGERPGGRRPAGNPGPAEGERETAPIAGEGFRGWSDRLRDVEEMIDDQDLRAEAARIRDRARDVREEVRHAKAPNWGIVRMSIVEPLNELRRRVGEEILRRAPDGSLVPIDRDPVPPRYADSVRDYYEKLGSGK